MSAPARRYPVSRGQRQQLGEFETEASAQARNRAATPRLQRVIEAAKLVQASEKGQARIDSLERVLWGFFFQEQGGQDMSQYVCDLWLELLRKGPTECWCAEGAPPRCLFHSEGGVR